MFIINRVLTKSLQVIIIISLASPIHAITKPNPSEVLNWARDRAPNHPGLREKLKEINGSYEVVFIPGVLGSKLRINGFVYGEDKIDAKKLLFNPNKSVSATILEEFKAKDQYIGLPLGKLDIYGSGLDLLQRAVGGRKPYEFAYDWRQDIDRIADEFQKFAEKELARKRVIVVAHSMGGVIAWHWKNKNKESRPFTLVALVLLGSPLQGSCEVSRMLVEGYGPPENSGTFTEWAYHLIFGKARAAIFTFPSVFELLPMGQTCIKVVHNNIPYEQNHFEIGFWEKEMKDAFRKFADDVGMRKQRAEYRKMISLAIDAAKSFHDVLFDRKQHEDTVYYLYSSARDMRSHYLMNPSGGQLEIDYSPPADIKGDGRVAEKSATHDRERVVDQGGTWPLNRDHGELLSDDRFGEFVEKELRVLVEQAKMLEIVSFAEKDPILVEEIKARKWVFSPKLISKPLEKDLANVLRTVARLNVQVVASDTATDLATTAKVVGRELEPVIRKISTGHKVAAVLFESAWVLEPSELDARTLNRLGYIRLREGRVNEAAGILKKAAKISETRKDPHLTKEIKAYIYGNLGVAYERAGFPQDALRAYSKGAELGSRTAASKMKR